MSDFPAATPACLHSSLHSNRRMLRKCESDTSPSLDSNAFPSRQSSGPSPDDPLTPHVSSFRLAHVTPGVWSDTPRMLPLQRHAGGPAWEALNPAAPRGHSSFPSDFNPHVFTFSGRSPGTFAEMPILPLKTHTQVSSLLISSFGANSQCASFLFFTTLFSA